MNYLWLTTLTTITFLVSIIYLYMFSRKQERFMQIWGFSWIAYSCSLLCLLIYMNNSNDFFLEFRKVIDMANLLLLLMGSYSFMHVRIPTYWYKFTLYMLLLALICIAYDFDLLSFYLPISVYQIVITFFLCFNIVFKWQIASGEKLVSCMIFLLWGLEKSFMSILEIFTDSYYEYMNEIILSNVLNFCILVIYILHAKKESDMSDNLYKVIVDNTTDVIFYYRLHPYAAFEYISPSVDELIGFPPSRYYNNPSRVLELFTNPETAKSDIIICAEQNNNEPYVTEMIRRDGEKFWGEFKAGIIKDENGLPIALEGTLRDVTNLKTIETERLTVSRNRNMLLSYISHELRTPITSISGYLAAINDGVMKSEEDRQEAMEIITTKTFALKKLIDDLDQLTKLETHQFTFNFTTSTVSELTQYLIDSNLAEAKNSGFEVEVECSIDDPKLPPLFIVADSERINQVFTNIITNAIKYSYDDKYMLWKFSIDETEEYYTVSVSDRGRGIRQKDIPYVFDRFYRSQTPNMNQSSPEGRGLGLTLCKEIIEAHQGKIYAESIYEKGSTFTFIIPLYKES